MSDRFITIKWYIEDVQHITQERFNKTISDKDALIVLDYIDKKHDANIGINWDVIELAIEDLQEHQTITLVEV